MKIFAAISKGFNDGRERARNEAYRRRYERARNKAYQKRQVNDTPIKLVEPSVGRTVELQVTEQDDYVAKLYMDCLTTYAKVLEYYGAQYNVTDKMIRFTFPNSDMAESLRQSWKK